MKQKIFFAAGLLVSAVCLFYVFKNVDMAKLGESLRSFNFLWIVPTLAIFYAGMYVRAARWGRLFRPHYELSGRRLFRPLMICFALNGILPSGRVGEVVRAIYVGKREGTGLPTALATIVTERLIDGLTLLVLLGAALAMMEPIDPSETVSFWGFTIRGEQLHGLIRQIVIFSAVLSVGVGLFLIPAVPRLLIRLIEATPTPTASLKPALIRIVEGAARGFESLRNPSNFAFILFQSLIVWGTVALSTLTLSFGFQDIDMQFGQAVALMSLTAFFIIIPAAPGYWGLYEAGVIFSLKALGVQEDDSIAAGFAIVLHLVQFIPIVVIGLIFAAQSQVKVGPAQGESGEAS